MIQIFAPRRKVWHPFVQQILLLCRSFSRSCELSTAKPSNMPSFFFEEEDLNVDVGFDGDVVCYVPDKHLTEGAGKLENCTTMTTGVTSAFWALGAGQSTSLALTATQLIMRRYAQLGCSLNGSCSWSVVAASDGLLRSVASLDALLPQRTDHKEQQQLTPELCAYLPVLKFIEKAGVPTSTFANIRSVMASPLTTSSSDDVVSALLAATRAENGKSEFDTEAIGYFRLAQDVVRAVNKEGGNLLNGLAPGRAGRFGVETVQATVPWTVKRRPLRR